MKNLYLIIITLLSTNLLLAGGPWANGKGHKYILGSVSLNYYNAIFYGNGKAGLFRAVHDNTYQLYGEYGITDKLSLLGYVPFKAVRTSDPPIGNPQNLLPYGSLFGLGNIGFAGKYTFYDKKLCLAGQLLAETAANKMKNELGLRTGYGAWSLVPSVLVGIKHNKIFSYINTGYALRTKGYSEEVRGDLEFGYQAGKTFWVSFVSTNKFSMKNGVVKEGNMAQTFLYVNNQSHSSVGLKLIKGIGDKYGVRIGANIPVWGDNISISPTFHGGVYYKW